MGGGSHDLAPRVGLTSCGLRSGHNPGDISDSRFKNQESYHWNSWILNREARIEDSPDEDRKSQGSDRRSFPAVESTLRSCAPPLIDRHIARANPLAVISSATGYRRLADGAPTPDRLRSATP